MLRWLRWGLAALGAYCLFGAFVIKHGWAMTVLVFVWPAVFNLIALFLERPAPPPNA